MKKIVYMFFAICIATVTNAQQASECSELFEKATAKVAKLRSSDAEKGFELIGRIIVTTAKGDVKQEKLEVRSFGHKYSYVTNAMTLYQDNKSMVVIQEDAHSIFITKPLPLEQREEQFGNVLKLQDSLRKHMVLKSCTKEFGTIDKNTGYNKIVFEAGAKLKGSGVNSISYWIEPTTVQVKKIMISFDQNVAYGIKTYEMIVDKMVLQTQTQPFEGEAIQKVLNGKKLSEKYKQYSLIDKRS